METLRKTIFTNWHFTRWLRLAMGVWVAFEAIRQHHEIFVLLAGLLIFQALSNTGCGASGCAIPTKKKSDKTLDIEFEEIKGKN